MDRRYNRTLPIDEQQQLHQQQVVQYEEVLAEDDGGGSGQYMDPNEMADQGMYYEEYADVDPTNAIVSGHGQAAYYEQVIEERPMALRPGMGVDARGPYLVGQRPLLNPYPPSNHRFVQQQQQRYVHSPSLLPHIRPYHQQQHQQPAVTRYVPPPARFVQQQPQQQQQPRTSTSSLVYTPPTSLAMGPRREAGGSSTGQRPLQPYTPNFSSLFPSRTPKPAKIRKMASKKKPCNCTKSMCLKLYCDCFANGEFCLDCNCKDCHNNLEHEAERSRAIKSSLERNPTAFKPKIGVAAKAAAGKVAAAAPVDMERLHQRGCHCKKSNCLKNYCECFEAKVPCTERCKCQGCRNTEHDRHHKKFRDKFTTAGGLAQLAAAAAADNNRARSGSASDFGEGSDGAGGDREEGRAHGQLNPRTQPWHYMSEDVIEATTMCLVSQAKEFESTLPEEELEKSVLREFGRCLEQIIESANSCVLGASHA